MKLKYGAEKKKKMKKEKEKRKKMKKKKRILENEKRGKWGMNVARTISGDKINAFFH